MNYLLIFLITKEKEEGLVTKALMLSGIKVTLLLNNSNWLRIMTEKQHQRHIVVVSGTTNFIYDVLYKVGLNYCINIILYCIMYILLYIGPMLNMYGN